MFKRCKYCGAVLHDKGCPNNSCIAYIKVEPIQIEAKKKTRIKKS